jgi:hypothetical protein
MRSVAVVEPYDGVSTVIAWVEPPVPESWMHAAAAASSVSTGLRVRSGAVTRLLVVIAALAAAGSATAASPPFTAMSERVSATDLPFSWRPGCPVPPSDLRRLRLAHWGFDGERHVGTLVVHRDAVAPVTAAFRRLYRARFPVRRMRSVDAYRGSDDASMAADNTSAFNCRPAVTTGPRRWSQHSYGLAIDVNPVENPYLLGGRVLPPAGERYLERRRVRPGMAVAGGVLVRAFASVGWSWGGDWGTPDYQHFSSNGR